MRHLILILLFGVSALGYAENEPRVAEMPTGVVQLDETVISGNQELPKVLYILP